MRFLEREQAPFGAKVWEELDKVLVATARASLVGRRFLEVEGPYGLETAAVAEGKEELVQEPGEEQPSGANTGAAVAIQSVRPLAAIHHPFAIGMRNVAAFECGQAPLDADELALSVQSCAMQEDKLVFYGSSLLGEGLTNAKGAQSLKLKSWKDSIQALEDVLRVMDTLDGAGALGPYALALSPPRYNSLFRAHEGTELLGIDHLARIVGGGIFKTPVLAGGGVMMGLGSMPASILLGQDMTIAFRPSKHLQHHFMVLETVGLTIGNASAICVLNEEA